MTTTTGKPLRRFVLMLDAVILGGCGALAYAVHPALQSWQPWVKDPPEVDRYALLLLVTVALWVTSIAVLGAHRLGERPWSPAALLWSLVKVNLAGLVGLASVLYLTQAVFNRSLMAVFLATSFALLYLTHLALSSRLRQQYESGLNRTNILLVGNPGPQMADFVGVARELRYPPHFVGRLGAAPPPEPANERYQVLPDHLGSLEALEEMLHDHPVDEVAFFPPWNVPSQQKEQLTACEALGVRAYFSVSMEQPSESRPQLATQHHQPFVLFDIAPRQPAALLAKQLFDTVSAALGILVISPLLILTTLAVWISMGRPIFFSQKRAGLFGREFRMLKFRTMRRDAEQIRAAGGVRNELTGPVFKSTSDPRITPLGRFLRRWSIDELPQLFNVLGGAMSLVGPRPLPIDEQRQIRGWRRRRLSMKPGITGLWQVSGRSEVDFEEWIKLDLRYVDEWSLSMDAILLLRTLKAVITGKGAV